jgi:hypothetical protein
MRMVLVPGRAAGVSLAVAGWFVTGSVGKQAVATQAATITPKERNARGANRTIAQDRCRRRERGDLSTSHSSFPALKPYPDGINSSEPADTRQTRVALLVDYPVLMRAVRAVDTDAVPRLGDVVRRARTLGSVVISRAYGAWYDIDESTTAFNEGLDPVFVPPAGPGNVPSNNALVGEGLALLHTGQIQALALSGDDRLLPLVTAAHAAGVPVALIAHSCQPDGPCVKLAISAEPASAFVRTMSRAERYRRPTSAA